VEEPPNLSFLALMMLVELPEVIWRGALGVLFLLISGIFSATIAALSRHFEAQRGSANETYFLSELTSAQLGRTIAVFAYVVLLHDHTAAFVDWLLQIIQTPEWLNELLGLGILAFFYVLIVLQLGRMVAEANPEGLLKALRFPLRVWKWLTYPLWIMVIAVISLMGKFLQPKTDASATSKMLRRLLDEKLDQGKDEYERRLLKNVLDFGNVVAKEVMVPRPDVTWLDINSPIEEVQKEIASSSHTRLPLCDGTPDKVLGYLHAKDIALAQSVYLPAQIDLRKLMRPVTFVPETAKAMNLLERFKKEHSQFAVVVDEFGGMSGIVTLEDVIEEVVGDIQDEFDAEETEIRALDSGEILMDGAASLEEIENDLGLDFGDVEEETLGGFVFGKLAREAKPGDEVSLADLTLRVEEVEGLRVTRVRIIPKNGSLMRPVL
jgi:CBS domain containing-hemolysin-like protein